MIIESIKDLKKLVLLSKKESKELSQAYGAVLKQVENLTIGVSNPETDEKKIIVSACKKELKEIMQCKNNVPPAPYSQSTLDLCETILLSMTPKLMSERETEVAIDAIIAEQPTANMGQIMGIMKKEYGESLDMAIVSKVVKQKLSK